MTKHGEKRDRKATKNYDSRNHTKKKRRQTRRDDRTRGKGTTKYIVGPEYSTGRLTQCGSDDSQTIPHAAHRWHADDTPGYMRVHVSIQKVLAPLAVPCHHGIVPIERVDEHQCPESFLNFVRPLAVFDSIERTPQATPKQKNFIFPCMAAPLARANCRDPRGTLGGGDNGTATNTQSTDQHAPGCFLAPFCWFCLFVWLVWSSL